MNTEVIIALIFSGIGTITGTIALIWNIFNKRTNFKVIIEYAGIIQANGQTRYEYIIRIMNKGNKPVQIEEAGFFLSNTDKINLPKSEFPSIYLLGVGESKTHQFDMKKLRILIDNIKVDILSVYARDSQNNISKGSIPKKMKNQLKETSI